MIYYHHTGFVGGLRAHTYEKLAEKHPTIKYSALRGYDKVKEVLKKDFKKEYPQGRCSRCGEPAANDLCKACSFLEELGL